MQFAILATLFATASAFTNPTLHPSSSPTQLSAFKTSIGAQAPLGFFDPLGMLADADQERFDRLRSVEIKHGRISMLAVVGNLVTGYGVHLPGSIDKAGHTFASIPTGMAAFNAVPAEGLPTAGIAQIVGFIGCLELFVMKDSANGAAPGAFPGDFRNGYIDFGWDKLAEKKQNAKRGIELNNGRAAMMGILGMMVHEQINGEPLIINKLLGMSGTY